jgi:hypothetical protein
MIICVKQWLKGFIGLWLIMSMPLVAMNLLEPYDTIIRPPFDGSFKWQITGIGETGFGNESFNQHGQVCDVLHIWQTEQDALAMLNGFAPNTPQGQLRTRLDANDAGTRGHFRVTSHFKYHYGLSLALRRGFLQNYSLALYLPMYSMELKNVCWQDLTQSRDDADVRVKELLTNNIFSNVCTLGESLSLQGWKRTGVGDLTVMLEWFRDFPQPKPLLKLVNLNWRIGLNIPTGKPIDQNETFAFSFGNDGAASLIFGFGLNLNLGSYFKTGVDVQLTQIFDNTRVRRIKTAIDQTELLLLQKTAVHKDFGLTQRFNLYIEFYKVFKGLSGLIGYQYKKHGDDTVSLCSNNFSNNIANTAQSLQEWTMHQAIVKLSYDFAENMRDDAPVVPYLALFSRIPFNGKRVAMARTLGVELAVNF